MMRRSIAATLACLTVTTLSVLAGPSAGAEVVRPMAHESMDVGMDARTDAAALRTQAAQLRRDVTGLIRDYRTRYQSRFTSAELAQLVRFQRDADRQLAGVVVTTNRLSRVVASRRSAREVDTARRAAQASWARAREAADTSWEQARGIMEPRLSLLEKLEALGDYNDAMARFDDLGQSIDAIGR